MTCLFPRSVLSLQPLPILTLTEAAQLGEHGERPAVLDCG